MTQPPVQGPASAAPQALESVAPVHGEVSALTDRDLSGRARPSVPTTKDLGPLSFPWPTESFTEFLSKSSGSAAGHSAVSGWLGCPEQSRLYSLGIRRKPSSWTSDSIDALAFGTLCHVLSAVRPVYGESAPYELLHQWAGEIDPEAVQKAELLFRTYDLMYPLRMDPFQYLGVESEVYTDIGTRQGNSCVRTVRYDAVVRLNTGEIFSLEKKTMARSGNSTLAPYTPQAMIQQAIWNANSDLVAKYGAMRGVIFDCLIKTATPNVERLNPKYFSKAQEQLALDYMRLPDDGGVTFAKNPDGTNPRMLHACWGRWRPCQYIGLCHEGAWGDYEDKNGETYGGP